MSNYAYAYFYYFIDIVKNNEKVTKSGIYFEIGKETIGHIQHLNYVSTDCQVHPVYRIQ